MKSAFAHVFPTKPIIGMIHLMPLPGSPKYKGNFQDIVDDARRNLESLEQGGVDGLLIENFFDTPFFKDRVPPETIVAMTKVVSLLREETKLPMGINVLRNDTIGAMAIASLCNCQFIRAHVFSGVTVTDQGIVEGNAGELLRYRRSLDSDILVLADCVTRYAVPLVEQDISVIAEQVWHRANADALIVSGETGHATDIGDINEVTKSVPEAPLLVGSGVTMYNCAELLEKAHGIIVGTYFKQDGDVLNPVDINRVKEMTDLKKQIVSV